MKSFIVSLSLLFISFSAAFAQKSSLSFFTQEGEKFYVILNGTRQNDKPMSNVKLTDLELPNYKAKIIFENPALGSIDKNLYTRDADGNYSETVYNIRKDKKGTYIMRLSGYSEVTPSSSNENVIKYHAEERNTAPEATPQISKTTTTTTTTTTNTNPEYQENINVNINGLGVGMNVNTTVKEGADGNVQMNVNTNGLNTNTTVKQTTTTTTTTSTNSALRQETVAAPVKETRCSTAASSTDFAAGKKSISSSSFAETQLKTAKTFTKNNCLSVAQIKDIMNIFSFEESKLDYAKYAYDYCVDVKNYYQIVDAFTFSSSKDELNEFLESK